MFSHHIVSQQQCMIVSCLVLSYILAECFHILQVVDRHSVNAQQSPLEVEGGEK